MKKRIRWICSFLVMMIVFVSFPFSAEAKNGSWKHDKKGYWYSYSDRNYAKKEWLKIDGKWYFFADDGYMVKNWYKISAKWYYFGKNGAMRTGWQKISGKWYCFDKNGAMITGWKKMGTDWYFFNSNGMMQTGWKKISSSWYYFDKSGVMATGTQTIDGKTYTFGSSGVMYEDNSGKDENTHGKLLEYQKVIEPAFAKTWGSLFYEIKVEGNDMIITVWDTSYDRVADAITNRTASVEQEVDWLLARNKFGQLAKQIYDGFSTKGIKNANCTLDLVSWYNHNKIYWHCYNGELKYDSISK